MIAIYRESIGTVLFDSKKFKKRIKLNESGQKEPSLMIPQKEPSLMIPHDSPHDFYLLIFSLKLT